MSGKDLGKENAASAKKVCLIEVGEEGDKERSYEGLIY